MTKKKTEDTADAQPEKVLGTGAVGDPNDPAAGRPADFSAGGPVEAEIPEHTSPSEGEKAKDSE